MNFNHPPVLFYVILNLRSRCEQRLVADYALYRNVILSEAKNLVIEIILIGCFALPDMPIASTLFVQVSLDAVFRRALEIAVEYLDFVNPAVRRQFAVEGGEIRFHRFVQLL